ncbi:MAG: dihydroneopterin aldolase [Deltaproteobacteria bacterium]|nr:dihydroneopterin aldolase [Deltaproteobacteria bacterium]
MGQDNRIFIEGLQLSARIGVYRKERGRKQPLRIDIEVEVEDLHRAARSERLRHTLNYEKLAEAARRVVERRHYPLVETLADTIAREVLQLPRVQLVRVRLHKLGCIEGAESAGAEVELRHEDRDPRLAPLPTSDLATLKPRVTIVGGGVAGLSAALWCWRLGHPALLLEPSERLGGQLHLVHFMMFDLPGQPPISGVSLAKRFWRLTPPETRWAQGALEAIHEHEDGCELDIEFGNGERTHVTSEAVILAMGLRRRRLAVPGERGLMGRGILSTASRDISQVGGQKALVVGGSDGACENALKLAAAGSVVTLVHRGPQLTARQEFQQALTQDPRIEVRLQARVVRFLGDDWLEGVELHHGERIEARWALIRVGWHPNSEALPEAWLNQRGYVRSGVDLRVEGTQRIFVAGDLRDPAAPSVAAAAGDGACAAKAALT